MDTICYHISKMKSVVGNNGRLSFLFTCALVVLLTPHSNASIDRVFSLVSKNKSVRGQRPLPIGHRIFIVYIGGET